MHPCEKCGEPTRDNFRVCYQCMVLAQDAQKGAYNAQTPQNPYYTHPKYENAVERKETTQDARQEAIAKAHQDNMLANQMLVNAILKLADAVREAKRE